VADSGHDHLFISQGTGTAGSIVVTDFSGTVVATITGQDGVQGIALSPDGATLYAALASASAVTAISTSTLKETARYSLGNSAYAPFSVAVQSGRVWVSYDTGTPGQEPEIGAIDPAAANPAFVPQAAALGPAWIGGPPELAADPDDSGVLVAAEPGSSSSPGASFDTTTVPASVRAEVTALGGTGTQCENEIDVAVAPGGAEGVTACGAPYEHVRYDTQTLNVLGAYPSSPYPVAIAIATGTGVVAAGNESGEVGTYTYTVSYAGDISTAPAKATFKVAVALNQAALEIGGPAVVTFGRNVAITGTLSLGTGTPAAGTHITVVRTESGSKASKKFLLGTKPGGSFSLTDPAPAKGHYTYTASYGGDTYRVYHHTGHLNASVTVTPNKHGQCVDLLVQQYSGGLWFFNSLFGCFKLNSSSKLATYLTLLKAGGARYRMSAEYLRSAADKTNLSTSGSWFYFKVVK
jgi:hypothetical protein